MFFFLLNEHGDLYFLLLNNSVHIIFFNLKKFKTFLSEGKKDIGESVQKKKRIMECKTTTMRTLYVRVDLNGVIFRQISYDIVLYA